MEKFKNPYTSSNTRWLPTSSADELFAIAVPHVDSDDFEEILLHRIGILLHRVDVPVPKRFIESKALHVWRIDPNLVRDVIEDLRLRASFIYRDSIVNYDKPKRRPASVYGLRDLQPPEFEALSSMYTEREALLNGNVLGAAAERYVRHHFKRSQYFNKVTPGSKLGSVTDTGGKNRLDLAVSSVASGDRWAISIKNRREFLQTQRNMVWDDKRNWIEDVIAMAEAHSTAKTRYRPWLIPSFATPDAIAECEQLGVKCTPIGSRIAPEKIGTKFSSKILKKLYVTTGPEPWRYVGATRVHEFDEDFLNRLNLGVE